MADSMGKAPKGMPATPAQRQIPSPTQTEHKAINRGAEKGHVAARSSHNKMAAGCMSGGGWVADKD